MIDSGNLAAVVSAAAAVSAVYLAARSSIRRDHRDKENADAKELQTKIDQAIKADRDRQELLDAKQENAELRKQLRDKP